jgi:putative hemolysin
MAGIVILAAALLVGWLVAGGTVVRLASRFWLRHWAERGLRGVAVPLRSATRPQRLITSATLASALVMAVAGALLAVAARDNAGRLWEDLAVTVIVVVFAAQIVARAVARHAPAGITRWVVPALRMAEVTTAPVRAVARAVPQRAWVGAGNSDAERRRVQRLLREAELEGIGAADDAAIITGVVDFGDKLARDVMTPREEVFAVSDGMPAEEAAAQVARAAYTRVPVYHADLDHVVGLLHAFDLLRGAEVALAHPRPVATARDDTRCSDLLFRMLRDHRHLAIVQDRNRRTVGIVTLEDLLEELVGDIRDEHDDPTPSRA